jgi:hypothetical protein
MNSSGQLVLFRKGHGQQDQLTKSNCHSQSEAHFRRTEVNLPCSEKFQALFFIENCLVPRISTSSGLSTPLLPVPAHQSVPAQHTTKSSSISHTGVLR